MNAQQITLVQETFKKVEPIAQSAGELVYQRLFQMDPNCGPTADSLQISASACLTVCAHEPPLHTLRK
jgi:hypothetical protein